MNVKDSIRKRLNKSFAMISLVCSIGLVICGISLFVISSQYQNALTNYGFVQGDIGKAMTTFSEARSSLRAVIGYTDMNEIADEQKKYETKKSAFEGYMADIEKTMVSRDEVRHINAKFSVGIGTGFPSVHLDVCIRNVQYFQVGKFITQMSEVLGIYFTGQSEVGDTVGLILRHHGNQRSGFTYKISLAHLGDCS